MIQKASQAEIDALNKGTSTASTPNSSSTSNTISPQQVAGTPTPTIAPISSTGSTSAISAPAATSASTSPTPGSVAVPPTTATSTLSPIPLILCAVIILTALYVILRSIFYNRATGTAIERHAKSLQDSLYILSFASLILIGSIWYFLR